MGLSNELISQFVKVTKSTSNKQNESTVYGTIVEYDGAKYVKIDGSELLTPISATTNIEENERVTVSIKNHTATVTGNLSSPSARTDEVQAVDTKVDDVSAAINSFETLLAKKVDTTELNAQIGRIDDLVSDNVTIKETLDANTADIGELEVDNATIHDTLTAQNGDITELKSQNVTVTEKLTAVDADIDSLQADNVLIRGELTAKVADIDKLQADNVIISSKVTANEADINTIKTDKLSVKDADVRYANIDFANIGEAAVSKLFSESGIIESLVMNEGKVTGRLVGVTIIGDLIEAGTLKADKLVILGTDGLYYKLNYDGKNATGEQTDYNSLHGSIITANSITAEKIHVSDLVAFDATIGGYHITEHSIYSGVKESATNTTRGVYMDDNGQMAFGDDRNFVRFFKDTDGNYKLEITAAVIKFGSNNKNLEEALDALDNLDDLEIGGKNLLQYTDVSKYFDEWEPWALGEYSTIIDISEDGYLKVTPDNTTTSSGAYPRHSAKIEAGVEYTLSFLAYADSDITLNHLHIMNPDGNVRLETSIPISTTPDKYTYTFTTDAAYDPASIMIAYHNSEVAAVPFYIRDMKLERGNCVTDWTESPEDTEHAIDEAKDAAASNAEQISDVRLVIDSLNAAISSLVIGEDGESLMTQTETGWTFNIAAIQNTLNEATSNIVDMSSDIEYMSGALNALSNDVDYLGVYTDYIQFGVDNGKPCIILGETDSAFKVLITNTDIRFVEGTSVPAYISNQSLHVEKAVISDELKQGGFVWIARENGNYGLLWKGE